MHKKQSEYIFKGKKGSHHIIPVTDNIFRCVYTGEDKINPPSMMVVESSPEDVDFSVTETENFVFIETESLGLTIDKSREFYIWQRTGDGEVLLLEESKELSQKPVIHYTTGDEEPVIDRVKTVDGERNFIRNLKPVTDRMAYSAKLNFVFDPDECIFGLGQGEDGIYNTRYQNQYLYQHNMRIPMPFFVSDKGYGIFADCGSLMTYQDDIHGTYLYMDTVSQLDYYFIAGDCLDDIIAGYRMITGRAAMLPRWAFGYVQSKERYNTADELLETVMKYRKEEIPLDCIVQDWYTWEEDHWGEKRTDKKRYHNLRECMDKIHDMGVHSMVSVWPNMNYGTTDHTEFLEAGYLLNDLCTYDAFSEKAREMYWQQAKRDLFDGGFDSWWCDSTEPFSGPDWNGEVKREPWERFRLVGDEHKHFLDPEVANLYATVHAKGIYENQRKTTEDMRVLNLTRSGYASIQRYGAVLWSGDTDAHWSVLKKQIAEGINMGLSGYPYWTLDIGAFFTVGEKWQNRGCNCNTDPTPKWFWQGEYDEGINDKGYKELYTRWFQLGTFLPMFRSHGTDTPREVWQFKEPGNVIYDTLVKFIRLRYSLMPYIYSLAAYVHYEHGTMMRGLLFDFPNDREAYNQNGEYMFGPAFLICPVTEPMYYESGSRPIDESKTWDCYLPAGTGWYLFDPAKEDHEEGQSILFEGGQWVTVTADITRMPIFVRAGSVIPMIDPTGIYTADQAAAASLEIHIFPGEDACFTLYEDEGNNYNFEKGAYSTTEFLWHDDIRTLSVGKRKGQFPQMQERNTLKVIIHDEYGGFEEYETSIKRK